MRCCASLIDRAIARGVARPFPFGTLTVNLSGAVLLGLLAGLTLSYHVSLLAGTASWAHTPRSPPGRWRRQRLAEERQLWPAAANIVVSVILGVAAAMAGQWIAGQL